jgi:hypothetical protein
VLVLDRPGNPEVPGVDDELEALLRDGGLVRHGPAAERASDAVSVATEQADQFSHVGASSLASAHWDTLKAEDGRVDSWFPYIETATIQV